MKEILILAICALFVHQHYGQSSVIVRKKIPIVYNNETKTETVAIPKSLEHTLTKLQRMHGFVKVFPVANTENWNRSETVIRVAEYLQPQSQKANGRKVFGPIISHRAWYPCIVGKNAKYVFLEGDVKTDTEMFNLFLQESQLQVTNSAQALALIEFYFSAARGYFENKGKKILMRIDDVPSAGKKEYEPETRRLKGIVKAPAVRFMNGKYEAVLYTWEILRGEVTRWDFTITPESRISVKDEIVGRL